MSYCRFGPDSDVYVYPSRWYADNAPCWVLMTVANEYPVTFFTREAIYQRLLELREAGRRIPDAALERLQNEMTEERTNA